ncbi:uncharacterized protein DFL_006265 [Arthrobotrys flagrans]|uniref:Uncharacterized protein n=1 Tax=Arthrobotrys flagrans TaxID=97331 RepID=A0A437A0Q6_ARTFL|nr:hypothetical protein DFL_006265 [Arthrobotrys flagrans]
MGRDGYIGIRDAWPAVEALSLYNGGPTPDQGLFWPVQCLTSTGEFRLTAERRTSKPDPVSYSYTYQMLFEFS